MLSNETRNQHFVSQVEQKLNATNPDNKNGKLRIYSFRIANRDKFEIALESPRGRPIASTLSMLDLFSFDVPGGSPIRTSLETLFHKYENNVEVHTRSLLEKLALGSGDIKTEIIDLFAAKFLNFVRNPYCIEKVLNSFRKATDLEPTDPELLATYRKIVTGQKPHQGYLCRQLGISEEAYIRWLRLMFILLMDPGGEHPTLFDSLIKNLFETPGKYLSAIVYTYDNDFCLLSDRSFSQAIPDGVHMSMSFNLCSKAFVDYTFADPVALVPGLTDPGFKRDAFEIWKTLPPVINVIPMRNHREGLARYNMRVIEQCRERVYCAAKSGLIIAGRSGG